MTLPDSIRGLLHEFAVPTELEGPPWERLIIERVMERGSWDDMRWLLTWCGRARLAEYLRARGHRLLPPRELRFWSAVTGIPKPMADEWVRRARERVRSWR
ncbi:MAG: hypothetical protein ACK42L_09335 [Thermoanaerobaculum sp.]